MATRSDGYEEEEEEEEGVQLARLCAMVVFDSLKRL